MSRPPLDLDHLARGPAAARSALEPPARRRLPAWAALLCAALMAGAALALAAVVVLGGWEPGRDAGGSAVHGELTRR